MNDSIIVMKDQGTERPCGPVPTDDRRGQSITPKTEDPFNFDDMDVEVDLSSVDESVLAPPHIQLPILKAHNYYVWAQVHKSFLKGRGLFGIVAGTLRPTTKEEARNWLIYDGWIATLLVGGVEETQQGYITHLKRAKAMWEELRRVHGVSGRGRLVSMMQRFHGYRKGANESIDQMVTTLRQLSNEISDLLPEAKPIPLVEAIIIMNACQGEEYKIAKFFLSQTEDLTPSLAVEQLRAAEQEAKARKDAANVAKRNDNGRPAAGQRGKSNNSNKAEIECYGCQQKGHIRQNCPTNPWKPGNSNKLNTRGALRGL